MRRVGRAALVVLAVGSWASTGLGIAFAEGHGHGHGATALGGSAPLDAWEQNTAQGHRQNNNCSHWNGLPFGVTEAVLTGGRTDGHCVVGDASFNKHAVTKGGGAHTTGGSGVANAVQQNTAQKGRQNNNCANANHTNITVTGGPAQAHCADLDRSRNHHTLTKGRGAHTTGGSAAAGVFDQNTAQEGRQNNNCADANFVSLPVIGGRAEGHCANRDGSRNHRTLTKGGGAHATGGSGDDFGSFRQNTAQEGRQNNNCADANTTDINVTGGQAKGHCANRDGSRNHHVLTKGRGAHTTGGSGAAQVFQQNAAQEGRQNNNCADLNSTLLTVTGGRAEGDCVNLDRSRNKRSLTKGGGAHTTGGSAPIAAFQQNTAQEGRQNNNCAKSNAASIRPIEGRTQNHCANLDRSRSDRTLTKGGGAHATGGSSLTALGVQQNTAQEGRQNNNCGNVNNTTLHLTGSDVDAACATVDRSKRARTAEISDGAKAEGGSGLAGLFQQNTAQDGRQNNNCSNANDLTLTATGSRVRTQCVAVDRSKNIGSVYR
ncbi:hypothetical protein [Streptomyces sp. NPDC059008]|uniref:hypothetical protein n=1 Tax=Streptomyces sp. NPDC059008 TaxID=3346693 RepID=UPI00369E9A7F